MNLPRKRGRVTSDVAGRRLPYPDVQMPAEESSIAAPAGASRGGGVPGADTLQRFADLIVRFAANVQPGQIVAIGTEPGQCSR